MRTTISDRKQAARSKQTVVPRLAQPFKVVNVSRQSVVQPWLHDEHRHLGRSCTINILCLLETRVQSTLPQERAIGTKIVRNTVSGALRLVVLAPIPFLLTPFLLRHVGTAGFGIWAVLLSFNGLTALADLGIVGTLTKHVSEHYTHRDYTQA